MSTAGRSLPSCRAFRRRVEQRIELAGFIEGVEIVAAADMGGADEDLRHRAASLGALDHGVAQLAIAADVEFGERYALFVEQFFRPLAVGAIRRGVDFDGG